MRVTIPKYLWVFLGFLWLLSIRTPAIAQGGSGVLNADPDFDQFYTLGNGESGAWIPFKLTKPGPSIYKTPVGAEGWPSGPALWISGKDFVYDGGVYQTVVVIPGHNYHFQVAWATVALNGVGVHDNGLVIRQVGIDPQGGTNPIGPTVQWSAEYNGSGKFAPELAIDAYAVTNNITIFLRAQNRYAEGQTDVYFDHALLTENVGVPPIDVAFPTKVPPTIPATAIPPTVAPPTRTRAPRAVPTATDTPAPTDTMTPTPTSTSTPEPTDTSTPESTATPTIDPSPVSTRLALSLATVICLGVGAGVVILGLALFLLRGR
jgi:hypothetical protein